MAKEVDWDLENELFAKHLADSQGLSMKKALKKSERMLKNGEPRIVAYPAVENWQKRVYGSG